MTARRYWAIVPSQVQALGSLRAMSVLFKQQFRYQRNTRGKPEIYSAVDCRAVKVQVRFRGCWATLVLIPIEIWAGAVRVFGWRGQRKEGHLPNLRARP